MRSKPSMASATVTASSRAGAARRRLTPQSLSPFGRIGPIWRGSRLGRTIIALNVAALLVLIGGSLVFSETRHALVTADQEALHTEANLIAQLLSGGGATEGVPEPALDAEQARYIVLVLQVPETQRVRIFDAQANVVADSHMINDRIDQSALPNLRKPGGIFDLRPRLSEGEAESRKSQAARKALMDEAKLAIDKGFATRVRPTETGGRVVSVSLPIKHVGAVLGVLTIEGGDVDAIVLKQRAALIPFIVLALLGTIGSSFLLNVLIARPVRKLSLAADLVRLSRARSISLPEISRRDDELGDLSRSLETMTDALSERMDAIERFAADVAHEIRNPLTSIRSAVETLDLVNDEASRLKLMNILKQDVGRMDRLITDISNASRLDAELSREQPRAIDVARLMGDIVAVYRASSKKKLAPVIFEAPDRPMPVAGREGPLAQVFRNLIDNALSFTTLADRPGASVRVSMRREGGQIITTVDDDGPGIPAETLERVFERFYTSRPKASRIVGGAGNSGLGLSIARQIALAHNGRLWAENRTGEGGEILGARFILALPAGRGA